MKKRIASIILSVCLCLTLLPTAAFAEGEGRATADKWDGSVATGFAGGTGTVTDPYQIATGAQLKYLAQQVNSKKDYYSGKYFKLTADIDLDNKPWTPIGVWSGGPSFQGSFDGGGHTISNLNVVDYSAQGCGLFGRVRAKAASIVIKDLTVSGSVTGGVLVGGVIGYCYGDSGHTFTVSNCHFIGDVTTANTNGCIGGVIGECEVYNSDNNFVITVENCTYSGGTVTGGYSVGGVVGCCSNKNASSTITVMGCANSGAVSGSRRVGGVVGYIYCGDGGKSVAVKNCANSGTITGSKDVGGVVGNCETESSGNKVTVESCLNTGTVSRKDGSDETTFGAVTGVREIDGGTVTVSDCYYLSGCIATDAGFTGDPDTGLTALAHKITTTLAEVYDETELRAAVAIGAKEIKLMNDIALSGTLLVTGKNNITLDLNGKVLSLPSGKTGSVIQVGSYGGISGKLTLTDSSTAEGATDPAPTHKFSVNESTGLWTLDEENGTKTVTGGVITGGNTDSDGGGVYVERQSIPESADVLGTFTMEGGTICGNTAHNGGGGKSSRSISPCISTTRCRPTKPTRQ